MGGRIGLGHFTTDFPLRIFELQQGPLSAHSHVFFEMVYVRRGHGVHFIDGIAYPIQAGDLYVISPDEEHQYAPADGGGFHIINILWMPDLVEEMLRAGADPGLAGAHKLLYVEPMLRRETRFAHRLHLSARMAYRVEVLLDEMQREQTAAAPGSELLLRHLFCALLVLLSRAYDQQSAAKSGQSSSELEQQAIVGRAIEYIETYHPSNIRVCDVAAHVAISPSRLAHVFKAGTGRGLIEYLHEIRIARVCSALLESSAPVGEIAGRAGYNDIRFFRRIFLRHTGCNPTSFRRHYKAPIAVG